jgi:hypothetical protein
VVLDGEHKVTREREIDREIERERDRDAGDNL